jgi:hypothetical protein
MNIDITHKLCEEKKHQIFVIRYIIGITYNHLWEEN